MKNMKTFIGIYCLMLVTLLLVGCEKSTANSKSDVETQMYVAIISKGWQHQFWQSVKMGADKAAKDYNIKITFEGAEGDAAVSRQLEMIESAISKKPAALILAACDSEAVIPELLKAKDVNIPVIGFDSGVDDSNLLITTVATDNFVAAGEAADKLAIAIGEEGEVAVLCHDNVSITGTARRDGFVNRMKEKHPKIKIVDIQYGGGDHLISKNITNTIIENHPNIKGIFATNEGSAIGLINGITEKDKIGKIVIVGYDAGKLQKDAVRSGVMLGAISQDPIAIGYKAVEAAYKISQGKMVPSFIDTGYKWYDKTNVDNEELKPLLYD